jgi:hypothetical protein
MLLNCIIAAALACGPSPAVDTRLWTDTSGHYQVEADLIAYSDTQVVLKKTNGELISIAVQDLSPDDQEYLRSKEAQDRASSQSSATRTWTLAGGLKVNGRVVDYASRDVIVERHLGKTYVNDQSLDNLPAVYQQMVSKIVNHFEGTDLADRKALDAWLVRHAGKHTYHCEGVLLELEDGDRYGIPFFLFSDQDQSALRPGWERWQAAQEDRRQQEEHSFLLRSQVQATQEQTEQMKQIAQVQLQLQAYDAGLFDLWEVALYPPQGSFGQPMSVVVPGRDSRQAAEAALQQYPNYAVGPIARVRRR